MPGIRLVHPAAKWLPAIAALFVAFGAGRYLYSAVYSAVMRAPWITVRKQVRPLLAQVWHGTPIANSIAQLPDAWSFRYGPMFYVISHPLALVARREETLYILLLIVGHLCFWGSLYLVERRFFSDAPWSIRLLVVGIALTFTPALEAMACACLDMWEMLAITAALFLCTSARPWAARLAAVPAMLGVLTKLMPVMVFLLLLLRNRVAGSIGLVAGAVVLTATQVIHGTAMGWGFPLRAINVVLQQSDEGARWWENDSLRGIVYKALAGFTLPPGRLFVAVDPTARMIADVALIIMTIGLVLFACLRLWRWTPVKAIEHDRILGAFAVAIVLLHLLNAYSTHQYWPSTLLGYAFVLRMAQRGLVSRAEGLGTIVSLVLIGNVFPKTVVVSMTGIGPLNEVLHSVPGFRPDQLYTFYALPGLGLVLLAIVVWRLQRRLVDGPPTAIALPKIRP